jgi:prepilin-type N-terminal cleavage/methylation domain-containing protein
MFDDLAALDQARRRRLLPRVTSRAPAGGHLMKRHAGGFTLIEVLVVIGIIAVIMSILLPAITKAREAGRRVQCASNMRTIGQAIHAYAAVNKGRAPFKGSQKEYPYSWNKLTLVHRFLQSAG